MQFNSFDELVGKRLLNQVLDHRGVMLVPDGTILTTSHIDKMKKFDIDIFDVYAEPIQEPPPAVDQTDAFETAPDSIAGSKTSQSDNRPLAKLAPLETRELFVQTEAHLHDITNFIHKNGKVPAADIEQKLIPFIMEMSRTRNLYQLFAELKSTGNFRYKQSIGVAVMATMLGRWLQLDNQEMVLLTTAASLYDVGFIQLPHSLLDTTSWFQPHEVEIMKTHARLGYELLMGSGLDQRVALVALQHHERNDGSGYPAKLKGGEIDRLSKIVALSDVYLAMISERPYRTAHPFYHVMNELYTGIVQNRFDSSIGMTFLNKLMSLQVGSDVILSDDRKGKILLINSNYPTSPLIALDNECLDLSKNHSVKIKEVIG